MGEVDTDGTVYIYKWYSYEEDGTLNNNFGGNGVSYKTGKSITMGSGDFGELTQLVVEIQMSQVWYNYIMNKYKITYTLNDKQDIIFIDAKDKSDSIEKVWKILGNTIIIVSIE